MMKRDAFLYLDPKEPKAHFAQCQTCMMWTGKGGPHPQRCSIHGKDVKIEDIHSCGLYVHGKPMPEAHLMKSVTPKESGLVHANVRCENCKHFDNGGVCNLFKSLNRLPNTQLDTAVHPQGCCNAWDGELNPGNHGY